VKNAMVDIDIMGNNFALSEERETFGYFSNRQVDMSTFMVQTSHELYDSTWQDAFRFVEPFSGGVWLALFVCMVVSGLVVYILDWSFYVERREEKKIEAPGKNHNDKLRFMNPCENERHVVSKQESRESIQDKIHNLFKYVKPKDKDDDSYDSEDEDFGERLKISLFDSFYLAFASFTAAAKFAPVSKSSKIFVGSWSLLILIIVATYTANLAATLTKSAVVVEEIQSVKDAIKLGAKTCVSTRNVYYSSLPTSYSNTDEISQLYPFVEVDGLWEDMYEYLKNKTCRVALLNREDITAALQNQKYCDLIVVSNCSQQFLHYFILLTIIVLIFCRLVGCLTVIAMVLLTANCTTSALD
jgi:hypothetical protein